MGITERIRLLRLVSAEVFVVLGVYELGRAGGFSIDWHNLSHWLAQTRFEDAAGAALVIVALVLACWLLLSTVSHTLVSWAGSPRAIRAVGLFTLPPVRRLVSRAVVWSIAASSVVGQPAPAAAKSADADGVTRAASVIETEQTLDSQGTGPTTVSEEAGVILPPHLTEPAGAVEPKPETSPVELPERADAEVSHLVTVQHGDHLWSLSENHLRQLLGRTDLTEHQIARYWVTVVAANRPTLRSGNPDLIYPGETILLPALAP